MAECSYILSDSECNRLSGCTEGEINIKRKSSDFVESSSERASIDQNFTYTIQRSNICAKNKYVNYVWDGEHIVKQAFKPGWCNAVEFIISIIPNIESIVHISEVLKSLDLTFQSILSEILPGFSDSSLIQTCVSSPMLPETFIAKVSTVDAFCSVIIMNTIEFAIQITRTPDPFYHCFQVAAKVFDSQTSGYPGPKMTGNISSKCKKVINIGDDDNISMARALVVAMGKIRKCPKFKYLCDKRRPLQKKLAKQLHQNAKVPEGFCSIEEAHVFADYLGIKINIVDTELEQKIISVGKENETEVHLWRVPYNEKYHYNVITSID